MILKTDAMGGVVRLTDVATRRARRPGLRSGPARSTAGRPSRCRSTSCPAPTPWRPPSRQGQDGRAQAALSRGLDYAIVYDTTPFITESIHEVFKTLHDAVILVAIVVLLFLQNWRSALIPLIAVPVAIVGTFAVMAAIGFRLNNLTLFGLVLAIGIVVDDAIVVVEAVEHHIEHGLKPREATIKAMDQVSGAGDRRGPGAHRRVLALCVHHAASRPVLPPVRSDDRHLHGDLGVQLADLEPGACRPCSCGRGRKGVYQALPRLAFVAHWLLAGVTLLAPYLAGLGPERARSARVLQTALPSYVTIDRLIAAAACVVGGLIGWILSRPLNCHHGLGFYQFNRGFDSRHRRLRPRGQGAAPRQPAGPGSSTAGCSG